MKKVLVLSLFFFHFSVNSQETSPTFWDNGIVTDFTLTDINGVSHSLFDYLDAGKTVLIDVSATWCPPCWSLFQSGIYEEIWSAHGPAGEPGVAANTTDDIMLFFIEGDGTTTLEDLNGTGTNTYGNWISGTNYPIFNPNSQEVTEILVENIGTEGFPSLLQICPSRRCFRQLSQELSEIYSCATSCAPSSIINDASILSFIGKKSTCNAAIDAKILLQNIGQNSLTSATILLKEGENVLETYDWVGNLNTFETEEILIGSVSPSSPTEYTFEVLEANNSPSTNSLKEVLSLAKVSTSNTITVNYSTTDWASGGWRWKLFDEQENIVMERYFEIEEGSGIIVQPTEYFTSQNGGCYRFKTQPGCGFSTPSEQEIVFGSFSINDINGNNLLSGYSSGQSVLEGHIMLTAENAGLQEQNVASFEIFPNPTSKTVNLKVNTGYINSEYTIINSAGLEVAKGKIITEKTELDIVGFPSGIYAINIGNITQNFTIVNY